MGELVVGRPAPKQLFAATAPLDLTSAVSLTFRAGSAIARAEEPGFDRWLIDAYRALDAGLRHDLDLLLGFSGRLLYYVEELLFSFDPLAPDQLDATFEEYFAHLEALSETDYQRMAARSVARVYRDRGLTETPPEGDDPADWRMFMRPGITRANLDEVAALVTSPAQLKKRTLSLLEGYWRQCYAAEFERLLPEMQRASRHAQALSQPVVEITFSELTSQQLPAEIATSLPRVKRVIFCPSPHLGSFIQFILYEPDLILYFNAWAVLTDGAAPRQTAQSAEALDSGDVLDGLRALGDPSRMRILSMLRDGELYAQEIVGRLGISQSAVSRHLGTLESAELVTVRPANGMKYYAVDRARVRALAAWLDTMADIAETGN